MSAGRGGSTVVELRRDRTVPSVAAAALGEEIRTLAVSVLGTRLTRMFDGADDLLFEFAERAANNGEQRLYFETMRAVRLGRSATLERFRDRLLEGFRAPPAAASAPAAVDAELDFTLQDSNTLELDIAVANMSAKAEGQNHALLWEIGRRLDSLPGSPAARLPAIAIAPATICAAFRACTEALTVDFNSQLVIYKLFDRLVIGELHALYSGVLELLKHHQLPMAPAPARASAAAPTIADPAAAIPPPGAPPGTPNVGPTPWPGAPSPGGAAAPPPFAALEAMAPRYAPERLAAELAAATQGWSAAQWSAPQAAAYAQRTGLVGRMFDDILADPNLPASLHSPFDTLRRSVLRTALGDEGFVADPTHPLRRLINELAELAAASRPTGAGARQRLEALIGDLHRQFEQSVAELPPPPADAAPLGLEAAERFVEQQAAQSETRRLAMIRKVRRIVMEELQLRTLGLSLAPAARALLYSAWAPAMSVHLLRSGPDSVDWRTGLEQLDAVLASLQPASEVARDPLARVTFIAALRGRFERIGLPAARIAEVIEGYIQLLDELAHAPVPEAAAETPAAEPPEAALPQATLLEMLAVPGSWFHVYDHERQCQRWLKAIAVYAGMDCVAFAEFNGRNTLLIKSGQLLDDIVIGRAEPLDPSPALRRALDRFIAEREETMAAA